MHEADNAAQIDDVVACKSACDGVRALEIAVDDVAADVVGNDAAENVVVLFVKRLHRYVGIYREILDGCGCDIAEKARNAFFHFEIEVGHNVSPAVKRAHEIGLCAADGLDGFAVEIDVASESDKGFRIFVFACIDAVGEGFKLRRIGDEVGAFRIAQSLDFRVVVTKSVNADRHGFFHGETVFAVVAENALLRACVHFGLSHVIGRNSKSELHDAADCNVLGSRACKYECRRFVVRPSYARGFCHFRPLSDKFCIFCYKCAEIEVFACTFFSPARKLKSVFDGIGGL